MAAQQFAAIGSDNATELGPGGYNTTTSFFEAMRLL
jgi:hypothetical protein